MTHSTSPLTQKLKALEAKATKGPWVARGQWVDYKLDEESWSAICSAGVDICPEKQKEKNIKFIAATRNSLPALLEAHEIMRSALEELKDILQNWNGEMAGEFIEINALTAHIALNRIEAIEKKAMEELG